MPEVVTIIVNIGLGVIFLRGLLNAINPRFTWNVFESWKATKEPTEAYFLTRRISGIAVMVLLFGLYLFPYFMD